MNDKSDSGKVILYVVNDLVYFRAHREALANAISDLGHKIYVIAGNCVPQDSRKSDRFTLIAVDLERQTFDPIGDFRLALVVRRWVRKLRADIVHMITIKPALFGTLGLVLPVTMHGFRLVWTMPGLGKIFEPGFDIAHRLRKWLTIKGLAFAANRGAAKITVENEGDRQRLIDHNIASPECICVIDGTGLDLEHFSEGEEINTGPVTFLMATRLLKAKGVGTYIAAARQLREEGVDARFVLAGLTDPANPDAFDERLIKSADLEGAIEWRGAVDQALMPALLNEADIFCLPTQLQEGLPRSLMEAAACGCALIAPDQIPIRKFVEDGKTGWLLKESEEADLVSACRNAVDNPGKARRMGTAAAAHIRSLPVSDAEILQKFLMIYELESGRR